MSKKVIYILLGVIMVAFITLAIIIIKNKSNKEDPTPVTHEYAQNEVATPTPDEEIVIRNEYTMIPGKAESPTSEIDYKTGVEYTHLDYLTPMQQTNTTKLISMVSNSCKDLVEEHGNQTAAEVLASSDEYCINVRVTFQDEFTQDYVVSYDPVYAHSYLRCVTKELSDSIDNGDFGDYIE